MLFYNREVDISATVDDILNFLERENQFIAPYHIFGMASGEDLTVNYHCRREGNKIGIFSYIYTTPTGKLGPRDFLDAPDGPGNEVFGFKITKIVDDPRLPPRSLVKGFYDAENDHHKEMFLTRWVRLGMVFGADWAKTTQKELDELIEQEQSESGTHWDWTEWKDGPTPGSKMGAFALIPNTPDAKAIKEKSVYISYAWGGESEKIVDELDAIFQKRGVTTLRDKRAVGFKDSLKEFMHSIGEGKAVVLVISEKYLKSPNCCFELVQIAKNGAFKDRIFPIVLEDAKIYDPITRLRYVEHWENKKNELDELMKHVSAAIQVS